ncbi:deoxynucleoside kinase-like isoform X2 [Paramacrobiotus metropolitanus]|uniref:deoxynucleoside kinase-like isoform X2 n=1 Tax=Paramacrobiotus metropolitanus TaxID=2943436 RepID=UPI0024464E0C|nr:deoxynucleoside kinase-like isoform X2 [Paramacrobiotus metropolitanus]
MMIMTCELRTQVQCVHSPPSSGDAYIHKIIIIITLIVPTAALHAHSRRRVELGTTMQKSFSLGVCLLIVVSAYSRHKSRTIYGLEFTRFLSSKMDKPHDQNIVPVFRIALEGGVGAGKTEISRCLERYRPFWNINKEPVERWRSWGPSKIDYLQRFYDNKLDSKIGRELQFVIMDSYAELYASEPSTVQIHIYERSPLSAARIISAANHKRGYTSADDLQVIQEYYDTGVRSGYLPKMDGTIFLRAPPKLCRQRRLTRGDNLDVRGNVLNLEYEQHLYDAHEAYFNPDGRFPRGNTLVIDETYGEMSVEEKVESIISFIESKRFLND